METRKCAFVIASGLLALGGLAGCTSSNDSAAASSAPQTASAEASPPSGTAQPSQMESQAPRKIEKGAAQTQTGTVKWFDDAKGYGFISQDAGGADLFAHRRDIASDTGNSLQEGQRVEFEVKLGVKGLQAANVRGI